MPHPVYIDLAELPNRCHLSFAEPASLAAEDIVIWNADAICAGQGQQPRIYPFVEANHLQATARSWRGELDTFLDRGGLLAVFMPQGQPPLMHTLQELIPFCITDVLPANWRFPWEPIEGEQAVTAAGGAPFRGFFERFAHCFCAGAALAPQAGATLARSNGSGQICAAYASRHLGGLLLLPPLRSDISRQELAALLGALEELLATLQYCVARG